MSQCSLHEYKAKVSRWNQSRTPPAAAVELQSVMKETVGLKDACAHIEAWKSACKDEAWIRWYGLKQELLRTHLSISQQHTAVLHQELGHMKNNARRLELVLCSIISVRK